MEGLESAIGERFFAALVRHLAATLGVQYAFVSEIHADRTRFRTLAVWGRGAFLPNFDIPLAGTPCEAVLNGHMAHHPQHLQALFPHDKALIDWAAESYCGVPLLDSCGTVVGHLAIVTVDEDGRFRPDLFYRLHVVPLDVPPLRARRSDIPQLVMFFLERFSKQFGKRIDSVSPATMDRLRGYPWPGNVRKLQNILERAVVLSRGPVLTLDASLLPVTVSEGTDDAAVAGGGARATHHTAWPALSRHASLAEVERHHILTVLQQTAGVIGGPKGAARILHLHPNTLRSRMQKLGIRRPGYDIS